MAAFVPIVDINDFSHENKYQFLEQLDAYIESEKIDLEKKIENSIRTKGMLN